MHIDDLVKVRDSTMFSNQWGKVKSICHQTVTLQFDGGLVGIYTRNRNQFEVKNEQI